MYKLYFWAKRVIKNEKNSVILHRLAEKIIGYIEAYYNLFVKKMYIKHPSDKIGITVKKREQKIIVSLMLKILNTKNEDISNRILRFYWNIFG